jgi:hypothetical protein
VVKESGCKAFKSKEHNSGHQRHAWWGSDGNGSSSSNPVGAPALWRMLSSSRALAAFKPDPQFTHEHHVLVQL